MTPPAEGPGLCAELKNPPSAYPQSPRDLRRAPLERVRVGVGLGSAPDCRLSKHPSRLDPVRLLAEADDLRLPDQNVTADDAPFYFEETLPTLVTDKRFQDRAP